MPPDPSDDRGTSGLRGALSEVYLQAQVDGALGPLVQRLGGRSTIDDPLHGYARGLPAIEKLLQTAIDWMKERHASYVRGRNVLGIDRDVTEGSLSLDAPSSPDGRMDLPVAVVAERHRGRAIEVRVYHATGPFERPAARPPLVKPDDALPLPQIVCDHLEGLATGEIDAVLGCFESDAVLVDGAGTEHPKRSGALRTYYSGILGPEGGQRLESEPGGAADDGRVCAVELTFSPREGPERAALFAYERGDSGLLRALRLYE